MTINLPNDLESSVEKAVHSGRFASVDDAMAEAVRLLLRELGPGQPQVKPAGDPNHLGLGLIGALRDDADLLDQAVEHAMKLREERPWRLNSGE
jgi:Arc/MetJ-type ribon-helix-helix transcriptional regulator